MPRISLHSRTLGLTLAGIVSLSSIAVAQQTQPAASGATSMGQMQAAMQTMDRDMKAGMQAGNPDKMFAAMMTAHHQGAVDMSRIALRDIKDPELRRIAEKTVSENEKNIQELRAWQEKHR